MITALEEGPLAMKIAVVEPIGIPLDEIKRGLPDQDVVAFDSRGWSDHKLIAAAQDAEVLTLTDRPISAAVIDSLPKLALIAAAFTGIDEIDQAAARRRNVAIKNASGYASTAVSELVIGLMICLARDIPALNASIRSGGTGTIGTELRGKTLGIIGGGSIGDAVQVLAKAFGMATVVHDLDSGNTLEEVVATSDFVTLHVPETAQTKGMISAGILKRMKPTAYLINTARGPIVDETVLHDALVAGRLAGAALDVFDTEPPLPRDYPLLQLPNVIATPHIGFDTAEAVHAKGTIALRHIQDFVRAAAGH